MNVCSSALSEAALQVLFLASQANTAHPPHHPACPSCSLPSLSCCHFSHLSKSLTPFRVCARARLSAAASARSSCRAPRADISVHQKHAQSVVPRCSASLLSSSLLMSERMHRLTFISLYDSRLWWRDIKKLFVAELMYVR